MCLHVCTHAWLVGCMRGWWGACVAGGVVGCMVAGGVVGCRRFMVWRRSPKGDWAHQ